MYKSNKEFCVFQGKIKQKIEPRKQKLGNAEVKVIQAIKAKRK